MEKAVFAFLCPKVVDPEITKLDESDPEILVPVIKGEVPGEGSNAEGQVESKENEIVAEPLPILNKITPEVYEKCAVPDWYRRGGDIEELLNEASSVDWLADNGGKCVFVFSFLVYGGMRRE